MNPELLPNILGGVVEGLVGAVFGFGIAYFAFRLQHRHKTIEYEVSALKRVGGQILFEIGFRNRGNEPVLQPSIEVSLDASARILEYEVQPASRPGYDVAVELSAASPSALRIIPPFINCGDVLTIRFTSENARSRTCQVTILGLGLRARPRRLITYLSPGLLLFLYVVIMASVAQFLTSNTWAQQSIMIPLGFPVMTKTVTQAQLPWWLSLTWMLIMLLLGFRGAFTMLNGVERITGQPATDFSWRAFKKGWRLMWKRE